jgi:hypothetical protein
LFSPGPPVSSINKTDRHDITEILLKEALNTIKQTKNQTNLVYIQTLENRIVPNVVTISCSTNIVTGIFIIPQERKK